MKYLLTILSGILTGLAMPGNLFSYIVWISLFFYIKNMHECNNSFKRLIHTFIFSFSLLSTTLWWQVPVLSNNIPEVVDNYPPIIGFLGFLGMILLLSLPYFLIWLLSELYYRKSRSHNLISLVFFYSFAFTSAEALREFGDFAFTGGSLAYALYDHIGLIQIVSVTGYLGVTFLIVLINSFIVFNNSRDKMINIAIIFSLIYIINFSIERILPQSNIQDNSYSISAVQMNVPQSLKYTSNLWNQYTMFSELMKETESHETNLIIIPESAFMTDISYSDVKNALETNIRNINKYVILGYPRITDTNNYNTAWLYNKNGSVIDFYDKVRLTPFAEFLPYQNVFGRIDVFTLIRYYTQGENFNVFEVDNVKIGTQICFETYFPQVSQMQTNNGAQVLIAISNNGWFGTSTGLNQHFKQGVFRAIENRRDFVQVSNTGITGRIDRYGRIQEIFEPNQEMVNQINVELNILFSFFTKFKNFIIILFFIGALFFALF